MPRDVENVITQSGRNLMAASIGEEKKIIFTVAKIGTGVAPDGADITEYTALLNYFGDAQIAKKKVQDGGKLLLTVQFLNTNVSTPIYVDEIGIYAKLEGQADSAAVLFSYLTLGQYPDLILTTETALIQRVYDIPYVFNGAANVVITITPSALVSNEDVVESGGSGTAGQLLRLNDDGKFEVDITGDAATLGGRQPSEYSLSDHVHDVATNQANGFMSSTDKTNHDQLVSRVNQDLKTTATPTFAGLVVNGYIDGARFR